jgi:hypothetical protein
MEEFMDCSDADELRNLVSQEQEFPGSELWKQAQTFWIHPKIFEILDSNLDAANIPQRAGRVATEVMKALPVAPQTAEHPGNKLPDLAHKSMIFLWVGENFAATKVSTSNARTSEFFHNRAQDVMEKLNPKQRSQSRSFSRRHSDNKRPPLPSPDCEEQRGRRSEADQGDRHKDQRCGTKRRQNGSPWRQPCS